MSKKGETPKFASVQQVLEKYFQDFEPTGVRRSQPTPAEEGRELAESIAMGLKIPSSKRSKKT